MQSMKYGIHTLPPPCFAPSPQSDPARAGCAQAGQVQNKITGRSFALKQLFKPKKQNQQSWKMAK